MAKPSSAGGGKKGAGRTGRPTVLTPEVQKALCDIVELCSSVEDAAAKVGIARTTVFNWMQKGREQESGVYRDFLDAIEAAKGRRRVNINARMLAHGQKHWQALAWLAERTDPKRFGLRIKVQVNEEVERIINKLELHLKPEEFDRALEAISQPDDSDEEAGGEEGLEGRPGPGQPPGVGAAPVAPVPEPDSPA